ncbi:hypothetical protein [Klebsiella huaxiensis]|uniref:Ead/Ea22-like family protein n=1 Tax=Klebsiella huaxiensis TaxID=2153354 RepID=A0A564KU53_9ENTR|nr:hypothetical protein SB6422_05800 [Klebsiella huaxiensis]
MTITQQAVNELIASLESAGELSIREQKFLKLAKAHVQLAAENVALKQAAEFATASDMWIEQADGMLDYRYHEWYVDVLKTAMETPVTDRIVAGIKADGRIEGVNFAAGRLAAAFNHGFVDKPMAEVGDVVRMILTAKEDLANNPAEDGLSGEYAEKSLAEWEVALREGADK